MIILGVDYGSKNIGLAKWNSEVDVVLPVGKVGSFEELEGLIKSEKFDKIIVGLPLGLDSQENANTKKVRQFADQLKKQTSLIIELVDERFSSHQADRMGKGVSRDEKSAMVILQSYLEKK